MKLEVLLATGAVLERILWNERMSVFELHFHWFTLLDIFQSLDNLLVQHVLLVNTQIPLVQQGVNLVALDMNRLRNKITVFFVVWVILVWVAVCANLVHVLHITEF